MSIINIRFNFINCAPTFIKFPQKLPKSHETGRLNVDYIPDPHLTQAGVRDQAFKADLGVNELTPR